MPVDGGWAPGAACGGGEGPRTQHSDGYRNDRCTAQIGKAPPGRADDGRSGIASPLWNRALRNR
jgi:hypothetical protein